MKRSPATAFWLSLVPGAGHVYIGQPVKGIVLILLVVSAIQLADRTSGAFGIAIPFLWIFAMIDAHRLAQETNHRIDTGQPLRRPDTAFALGKWWGWALVVLGVVFTLDNFDLFDMDWLLDLWPVALIGLGVYVLRQPPAASEPAVDPLPPPPPASDAPIETAPPDTFSEGPPDPAPEGSEGGYPDGSEAPRG